MGERRVIDGHMFPLPLQRRLAASVSPPCYHTVRVILGLGSKGSGAQTGLRYAFGGAGLYRVDKLTASVEKSAPTPGTYTYVQLTLQQAWSKDAPAAPVARISGGPNPDGSVTRADVELHVGETIGVLLIPQSDANLGYPRLHPLGVFRDKGKGFTNGQLFAAQPVGRAVLTQAVSGLVGANSCPYDHLPDAVAMPAPVEPSNLQIKGQTTTLQALPDLPSYETNGSPADAVRVSPSSTASP